jgi:hypothetical protein
MATNRISADGGVANEFQLREYEKKNNLAAGSTSTPESRAATRAVHDPNYQYNRTMQEGAQKQFRATNAVGGSPADKHISQLANTAANYGGLSDSKWDAVAAASGFSSAEWAAAAAAGTTPGGGMLSTASTAPAPAPAPDELRRSTPHPPLPPAPAPDELRRSTPHPPLPPAPAPDSGKWEADKMAELAGISGMTFSGAAEKIAADAAKAQAAAAAEQARNAAVDAARNASPASTGAASGAAAAGMSAPAPSRYTPNFSQAVTPDQTVEGRINGLMSTDRSGNYTNPVVRQAVERSMQQMSGRGLLNSSMAQQAGQEAAIAKAIEIAGPDAERFFQQSRANQDATNVFSRDEQVYKYDLSKMSVQQANELEKMAKANGYDINKMTFQQANELEKMGVGFDQDMLKLDKTQAFQGDQFDRTLENNKDQFGQTIGLDSRRIDQQDSQFDRTLENNKDQFGQTIALDGKRVDQQDSQFNANLENNKDQFGQTIALDGKRVDQQNSQFNAGLDLDGKKLDQQDSQFNSELNFNQEKFDRELEFRITDAQLNRDSAKEATSIANNFSREIAGIKAVDDSYDLYLRRISEIDGRTDLGEDAKVQLKNSAGTDFKNFATMKGISSELNLGQRFTVASADDDDAGTGTGTGSSREPTGMLLNGGGGSGSAGDSGGSGGGGGGNSAGSNGGGGGGGPGGDRD